MPTLYSKKPPSFRNSGQSVYADAYRTKRVPGLSLLVQEYKRTIYTCANLNGNGVSNTPLRLYVKTYSGQRKSVLQTKSLVNRQIDNLIQKQELTSSIVNIEEVVRHPVLNLLRKVNYTTYINGLILQLVTQLYLDITGKAYWLVENNALTGIPENIWILPSQNVSLNKNLDTGNKNLVDYFTYTDTGNTYDYYPEDVIYFCKPALTNPYLDGMSCLQACYESNDVCNKFITHEDALLTNKAHPDWIVSPKNEEVGFGKDVAERFEKELKIRFGYGRGGGIYVPTEAIELLPVQVPVKDLATLDIHKMSKVEVANAFDVPYALISEASHNRQQLEAAEYGHAKHALLPRCNYLAAALNDQLIKRYDDTDRLFLAYDDPIPENRVELLQETAQLVMTGVITPNEARKKYDLPPLAGGDELRPINVSPEIAREESRQDGTADK
jgi:HK97 family phage portal protein